MDTELPDQPRCFRVHQTGFDPQDCTLHPDGRMSRDTGGQTLWSALSLDDMLQMNWVHAEIEWDPEPTDLPAEANPDTQLDLLSSGHAVA
ncbi:hypothetical protein ACFC26_09565 [Kitasatospora purpeofusca]|uniref:hypothetical protein n=1 Tax=Kitasatospora purpeofusca TaxID=67352 RepID=UPI0035E3B590